MALIVEDGTGRPDANSYASVAAADAWNASQLDGASWDMLDVSDKERALITATDVIDSSLDWDGEPAEAFQALQWPRVGARDRGNRPIDRAALPRALPQATAELARVLADRVAAGQSATAVASSAETAVRKVVLGEIEIEMADGAASSSASAAAAAAAQALLPKAVALKLRGLGTLRSGFGSARLVR